MQASIDEIDRAARTLQEALAEHREAVSPYFEHGHLERLHADLVTLRQALLGLQMGPLYWDTHVRDAGGDATHDDLSPDEDR